VAFCPGVTEADVGEPAPADSEKLAGWFPKRATVCGLPGALSVIVRVPVCGPEAVGVKVTCTVQLLEAAMEAPHVFVAGNPLVVWTDETNNGPVPVLVTVTCCAPLVVPVAWTPNESDVGDRVTAGAVPVPVIGTACIGMLPPKFKVSVPVRIPAAVGVKTTLMSHF
jgi:hypothetical protein